MEKHIPNLVSALWAFVFFAALLAAGRLVRPDRKSEASRMGFNSGERYDEPPWVRISARYQLLLAIAAAFLLSALLLYPAAANFHQWLAEGKGALALVAVGVYLCTMTVALSHAWIKGDLDWVAPRPEDKERKDTIGDSGKRIS